MKKIVACILLSIINTLHAQQPSTVFYDASIIDIKEGKLLEHQEVIIEGNKIVAVRPISGILTHNSAQVIDAKGKFIIPGFWDMHVHVLVEDGYKWQFPLLIANGIIGFREMWGRDMRSIDSLKRAMKKGTLPYFHITGPGHIIDGKKVYWPGQLSAPDPITAVRLVDSLADAKVDFIKIYSFLEPGVFDAIAKRCKQRNIRFAGHVPHRVRVTSAASSGMASMEHLYGFLIEACSYPDSAMKMKRTYADNFESGIASQLRKQQARESETFILSHFSENRMRLIARELKRNNTYVVPTVVMNRGIYFANDSSFKQDARIEYMSRVTRSYWKELIEDDIKKKSEEDWKNSRLRYELEKKIIRILAEENVMIMTGTDADMPYAFPGFGVHDEMALFVEFGMKPIDALRAATINPVTYLKMNDSLGAVEKGKRADFVLLNANPLIDISATRSIYAVMNNGRLYSFEELEKMKEEVRLKNSK